MLPHPWTPEPSCFYSHFYWGMGSTDLEYRCLMLYSRKSGFHAFYLSRKYFKWQKNILPQPRQNIQSDTKACAKTVNTTILIYYHFKLTLPRLCRAASEIPQYQSTLSLSQRYTVNKRKAHLLISVHLGPEAEQAKPCQYCLHYQIAHLLLSHPALLRRN